MTETTVLYTIGYEGVDLDAFVTRLRFFRVRRVVDVREVPLSRKRGFSKSSLRERLEEEGLEYVHLKKLGNPKEIRYKLKADNDYHSFSRAFSAHLENNMPAIEEAYQYAVNGITCLMCFERTSAKCHRSLVADKIQERDENGLEVVNI